MLLISPNESNLASKKLIRHTYNKRTKIIYWVVNLLILQRVDSNARNVGPFKAKDRMSIGMEVGKEKLFRHVAVVETIK